MLDEPTAVLVAEMARLQARTVGDTEDYVVTREFKALTTARPAQGDAQGVLRDRRQNGIITAEEASVINQIARELDIDQDTSTRSAPSTTSCCRRCRPSAGSPRARPRRRPAARTASGQLEVDDPFPEPAADFGQQVRVVGDAPPQLHWEWLATGRSRDVDHHPGCARPVAQHRLEGLHRADQPVGGGVPREPHVEHCARARVDRRARRSSGSRIRSRASSGTAGSVSRSSSTRPAPARRRSDRHRRRDRR